MSAKLVDYSQLAFDLIDELERLRTPVDVIGRMSAALGQFGFSGFLVSTTPDLRAATERQTFFDGWPNNFNRHYTENGFYKDDPVVAMCLRSADPFEWKDVPYDPKASPRAHEVMNTARDFGLKGGIAVPIHRERGLIDTVTMGGEISDLDPRAKRAIHLVALYAHSKALALVGSGQPDPYLHRLSSGEREALAWTAAGKTTWEISMILGVSEAAIAKRIRIAARKLGSVNKTQAVVEAIRTRQIEI
jgi:LuxR family transcriptional regulator, quorum-sensing system regulator BjaR1